MFESWAMPGSIGQLAFGRRLLAVDVHCCNGVGCVHDGEVGLDPVRLVGVLPLSHVRINVDASGLSLRLLAWMRVVGASYAQRRGDSHSPRVRVRSFEDGEVASNMTVWYLTEKGDKGRPALPMRRRAPIRRARPLIECGSSVLMRPDGTFCLSRR